MVRGHPLPGYGRGKRDCGQARRQPLSSHSESLLTQFTLNGGIAFLCGGGATVFVHVLGLLGLAGEASGG